MFSVKANRLRLQAIHLAGALLISLFNLASVMGQAPPPMEPMATNDWAMTSYNNSVVISVLMNDYGMSNPIDITTVQIVSGPQSGTTLVDSLTGMVFYSPNQGFSGMDQFQYTVKDTAGMTSNIATVDVWVENTAPLITFMVYEDSDDLWVFEGTVSDENPSKCIVNFGDLLNGESTSVEANGEFAFYKVLANGEEGLVSAQAIDELGKVSEVAIEWVFRY